MASLAKGVEIEGVVFDNCVASPTGCLDRIDIEKIVSVGSSDSNVIASGGRGVISKVGSGEVAARKENFSSVEKGVVGSCGFESKKSYGKSIRVFGSNDGSSGGVAVSGDQVVFINFDKGNGLEGSGLSPMGDDLSGPAIDLYVDLGDLEPLFQKGKVGEIVTSPCPSDRRWGKKRFFSFKNP